MHQCEKRGLHTIIFKTLRNSVDGKVHVANDNMTVTEDHVAKNYMTVAEDYVSKNHNGFLPQHYGVGFFGI